MCTIEAFDQWHTIDLQQDMEAGVFQMHYKTPYEAETDDVPKIAPLLHCNSPTMTRFLCCSAQGHAN